MFEKNNAGKKVLGLTLALGKFCESEGTFGGSSAMTSHSVTRPFKIEFYILL